MNELDILEVELTVMKYERLSTIFICDSAILHIDKSSVLIQFYVAYTYDMCGCGLYSVVRLCSL